MVMRNAVLASAAVALVLLSACADGATSTSSEGGGTTTSAGGSTSDGGAGGEIDPCADVDIPEEIVGTGAADPEAGDFTLEEALDGLPEGPGPLRAIIDTELGVITCTLLPEAAPMGVANFVGLARGRRPFKELTNWVKGRHYYDGIIFHRVIDNFMAQSGDPMGTGSGGPGYKFPDEFIGTETHEPGALSYANSGPDTNGSQYFIVAEQPANHLNGLHVVFGHCDPISVVQSITEVETSASDKPVTPIHTNTIKITRCAP
jgi:peptidyl-prolyl cis-trans isomerase A (cyclophilin A)